MCEAGVGARRYGGDHFEGNENTLEYNKPWTRCGPFLLGVMLACYQSQKVNKAGHLPAPGAAPGKHTSNLHLKLVSRYVYVLKDFWR